MILTLATSSMTRAWGRDGPLKNSLLDAPRFALERLSLRGLNIGASMLSGWSMNELDELRDRADKAACPCLVLIDETPLDLVRKQEKGQERVRRLVSAASRLGCNSITISVKAADTDEAFELVAARIRKCMPAVERVELNLLLAPHEGLTADATRLTELIKRIGGFRIGSLPSFGYAAKSKEPIQVLRRLAPYAGAIHATVNDFNRSGKQPGYDLAECVHAIRSVGFTNTLAIEYVGDDDPILAIEKARSILQAAIDAEERDAEGE